MKRLTSLAPGVVLVLTAAFITTGCAGGWRMQNRMGDSSNWGRGDASVSPNYQLVYDLNDDWRLVPEFGLNSEEDESTHFALGARAEYKLERPSSDSPIQPFVGVHFDGLYESYSQELRNQQTNQDEKPSFLDFDAGIFAGVTYDVSERFQLVGSYGLDRFQASSSREDFSGLNLKNSFYSTAEIGLRFYPFAKYTAK